jgi:hypothetical protein
MQYRIFAMIIAFSYAVNSGADSILTTNETAEHCILLMLNKPVNGAAEVMKESHFTVIDSGELLPSEAGRIVMVKDFDRQSRGRTAIATAKGVVAAVTSGYSMRVAAPFGYGTSEIKGLRTQTFGASLKQTLAFTSKSALILGRDGLDIHLPGAHGTLAADFISSKQAQVVNSKSLRVYDFSEPTRRNGDAFAVLSKEVAAQTAFSAAAVHSASGHVIAIDGKELVYFETSDSRQLIGSIDGKANALVFGNLGSNFYIRQDSKVTFYDTTGKILSVLQLKSPLFSMAWDASDSMVAFSTAHETFVYNIKTGKAVRIGSENDQWRRVAWSEDEGLLLTLNQNSTAGKPVWRAEVWDPATGENLPMSAEVPVLQTDSGQPYLTGLRGHFLTGDFSFLILRQNGLYSEVVQSAGAPTKAPPLILAPVHSDVIAIPPPKGSRRLN